MLLRASANLGLESCCCGGDTGPVESELEEGEEERAERMVPGGACPDCRTRSSSAVSSTMRGSYSTTLAVCEHDDIKD